MSDDELVPRWNEPQEPRRVALMIATPAERSATSGNLVDYRRATIEDLKRACWTAELVTGAQKCDENVCSERCVCDGHCSTEDTNPPIGLTTGTLYAVIQEWGHAVITRTYPREGSEAVFSVTADEFRDCSACPGSDAELQKIVGNTKRCIELIQSAPACKDAGDFVKEAIELAEEMNR